MDSTRFDIGSRTDWCNAMGKLHRLNGPARECNFGRDEWWVNGKRHRLDGPAVEWDDGSKSWYVDGERLTEEQFHLERVKRGLVGRKTKACCGK